METPREIPVYAFIKRELKNQIESGELAEGTRLASEHELARQYNVSRNPTRQAMRDLELEGYIVRSPGRGSFVAPKAQWQKPLRVEGWRTVALACPEFECHYTRSVVRRFNQTAVDKGFHTMFYFLRFSHEAEFEFLANMRNSGVEGVAFWLQHATDKTLDLLRKFQKSGYPFVLVDPYVRGFQTDFVVTDNEDIAYQLTKALVRRKHKNIAYITSELDNTAAEDRFSGYRRALKEAAILFNVDLMGIFGSSGGSPASVVSRIMAYRSRPTAFLCADDGIAANLLDELAELGFDVPGDVQVALVDDNELTEALGIPMISAVQAGDEMGRQSAEILLERIESPQRTVQQRFLKAELRVHAQVSREAAPEERRIQTSAGETA